MSDTRKLVLDALNNSVSNQYRIKDWPPDDIVTDLLTYCGALEDHTPEEIKLFVIEWQQQIRIGAGMSDLDKWAAEQCGVEIHGDFTSDEKIYTRHYGKYREWTLDDAQCREIVREHFKIDTEYNENGAWKCFWFNNSGSDEWGKGKTIAEAEINCIKAIREAQA